MSRNLQPRPAAAPPTRDPGPAKPPSRRLGLLALLLFLLLLLAGGLGGALWWHRHRGNPGPDNPDQVAGQTTPTPVQRPACSDDDDPKTLEPLEFGPPLEVAFDRKALDGLTGKPLPDLEVYPWQPEGLVAVLGEHRMRGNVFAVSPDGKTLAVSAGDTWIRLGPLETLHEKHILTCPGGVRLLAWSPEGDTLAVSCGDGEVRLFDVRELEKVPPLVALEKPAAPAASLSWSGDGKYLLGGDRRDIGVAWVWDVKTRKVVSRLKHTGPIMSVAFSPVRGDYRALTSGGARDGQLHLWDALNEKEERAVVDFRPNKFDTSLAVGEVGFSPDGKRAFSTHPDQAVRLWDVDRLEKGKEGGTLQRGADMTVEKFLAGLTASKVLLHTLKGHAGVPSAAFSPSGQTLITARFGDGGLWLWNAQDGKQVRRLATANAFFSPRFLPGGDRVVFAGTSSNDYNIHIHEVETAKEINAPAGHLTGLSAVALSPDGTGVASGAADLTVRLWELPSARQRHSVGTGHVWGVGYHPDGKRVYHFGAWGQLSFAEAASGKVVTPPYSPPSGAAVQSAAITRDGRYAVTGGQDGAVRMWRLSDGKQVRAFSHDGPATVTLTHDMRRAVRLGGSKARLLHLRCQEVKHEWSPAAWAPFLPTGEVVFFGGPTDLVWKITADGVTQTGKFDLNLSGMSAAHLCADGKRVAAVLGGRVAVFELSSGKQLWGWTPPNHFYGVRGVNLSPDGGHLLTANGDGTAYVVRLP